MPNRCKRRRAVQQYGTVADDAFERFPHFGAVAFDQAAGALHVGGVVILHKPRDHERTIQFKRHALGQTALIQFELRTHHDHGTTGIVHALAEQVAAEATLLAFEHVAQRFEFAASAAGEGFAALAVVNEAVNGFLQHALLVADDDIWRAEFEQSLQAVVAVDDAAIQVVQVGGGEASAVELHHRAQVGRDDRQDGQDHPFGAVAGAAERFHNLQAGGGLLALLLALGGFYLVPEFFGEFVEVEAFEHVVECLGAHVCAEDLSPALL
jgi:hypothetical protein